MALHILNLLDKKTKPPNDNVLSGIRLTRRCVFRHEIGAGTFGLVYLVEDEGTQYAAKIVCKESLLATRGTAMQQKMTLKQRIYGFLSGPNLKVAEMDLLYLEKLAETFRDEQCPDKKVDNSFMSLLKEVALHLKVHSHPNIATVHRVYSVQDSVLVTLMDYFPQGDLFGAIIERQIFSRHQRQLMKNCMLQLIAAVQHCAKNGVFHCDLKPENILVSYDSNYLRQSDSEPIDHKELKVCLIDFGLAMASDLVCCNVCRGSNFYMAPERIIDFNTNRLARTHVDMGQFPGQKNASGPMRVSFPTLAGDIWSLGVLFINVTCARNPWPIANIDDRHDNFFTYIFEDQAMLRQILPVLVQFNDLLNRIFVLNPKERISLDVLAKMVRSCDFFASDERSYKLGLGVPLQELHEYVR